MYNECKTKLPKDCIISVLIMCIISTLLQVLPIIVDLQRYSNSLMVSIAILIEIGSTPQCRDL